MGALSERDDEWQRQATSAAIAAARNMVLGDGAAINKNAPVGRLSNLEWSWIITAVIFAWIRTRAEQAASEGFDAERVIRMTGLDPDPWDAGAVAAILPQLADIPGIDWGKPLSDWSRDAMTEFLARAMALIRPAVIARDLSERGVTRKSTELPADIIPF